MSATIDQILEVDGVSRLAPDLADRKGAAVYEIKSVYSMAEGWRKLDDYVRTLNKYDPRKRFWHGGTAFEYVPPFIIPLGPATDAVVFPPAFGLIAYCVQDLRVNLAAIIALDVLRYRVVVTLVSVLAFAHF